MMTHGGMLWGAALYNNGSFPLKNTRFGESYSAPTASLKRSALCRLPRPRKPARKASSPNSTPLERWEISQPGNVLRVFERGGEKKGEIGNPDREEESGRPDDKLGERGFGTLLRTDPVFLGLQKTRLLDPLLSLPGTNDEPGDYRASGCTALPRGLRQRPLAGTFRPLRAIRPSRRKLPQPIPRFRKTNRAIPFVTAFTRSIPSSQCMVCHVHPGTNMVTTYFGYTWWDNEADGQNNVSAPSSTIRREEEKYQVALRNPEGAAARGLWSDPKFLEKVGSPEFNAQLETTQFADFHSHGWVFRAVYKRDRKGNLLDADNKIVSAPKIPTNSRKQCTSRTFTSKRACIAWTATSSRTPTATASSTPSRAPRSNSTAWIATARSTHAPP